MYHCMKGGLNTALAFGLYKASIFAGGGNFHRVKRRHSRADPTWWGGRTGLNHTLNQLKASFPGRSQVEGYAPVWQPVT